MAVAFFQIVAADIDGTLTSRGELSDQVLDAMDRARSNGILIVLVTGRIGSELMSEFPRIVDHADALVLENGAVAVLNGEVLRLAPPVDVVLDGALAARGVAFRRGEVLIATDGEHATAVVEAIGQLGLDCQIIRNRDAVMVLPAEVTKGSGLRRLLSRMNRSPHNVIAVGDAENDVSMLLVAELGVAVANAIPSVVAHADEVLQLSDGAGVAGLLTGPLLSGARRYCPIRRWIDIGSFGDKTPTKVPGSQGRIVVTGPSGSGKSHVIGLMAERWILAGYSVLVVDPEGDHSQLKELDNVVLVDSRHYLPEPGELVEMLHPSTSMIVDLSALEATDKGDYVHRLRFAAEAHREAHGFPHWVIYDEAHLLGPQEEARWVRRGGYVLSSYVHAELPADEVSDSDVILEMGPDRWASIRVAGGEPKPFTPDRRRTLHIRHRHKYAQVALPKERRFYFRSAGGQSLPPAATMPEFRAAVSRLDPEALEFHLERGDFARWLDRIVSDKDLAAEVASWEDELAAHRAAEVERIRHRIVRAVDERYS
ncbi:HAD-IIB family hydrolase [Mycolicibacterium hippocampi]|uniref:Phosphoglycolate phosphatase n=1 Tax=Mycolicibacterium hippocampi TaxID=659824 RepID=A0A7I9ZKV5_9MYCO|nr:phosphoglycolate phosphatase [Mycolicibacterium hippocampi]